MIDYEIRCIPKTDSLDTTHGVLKATECKTLSKRPNRYLYVLLLVIVQWQLLKRLLIRLSIEMRIKLEYDKKSYK